MSFDVALHVASAHIAQDYVVTKESVRLADDTTLERPRRSRNLTSQVAPERSGHVLCKFLLPGIVYFTSFLWSTMQTTRTMFA